MGGCVNPKGANISIRGNALKEKDTVLPRRHNRALAKCPLHPLYHTLCTLSLALGMITGESPKGAMHSLQGHNQERTELGTTPGPVTVTKADIVLPSSCRKTNPAKPGRYFTNALVD